MCGRRRDRCGDRDALAHNATSGFSPKPANLRDIALAELRDHVAVSLRGAYLLARASERIILGVASGNRDETVWERAGEFWLDRNWKAAPEILTFGPGPHLCLGNMIARMEARIVLALVIEKFAPGALRLAPSYPRTLVPMFLEYGPERLEVVTG